MDVLHHVGTRIVNSFKTVVLALILPVLLAACGSGAEAEPRTDPSPVSDTSPDTTSPAVAITGPTGSSSYSTSSATVTLSGSASDDVGVTQVTWTNSRGGGGTASGTVSWNTGGISLQGGTNVITVTARDAAGNTDSDTLTVTYSTTTPGDTTAPGISINSPTSSSTYTTTGATLSLGGTASDNVGVTQVTWANSRGGSGTASGTTSWSVASITLQSGANTLTVTARDAAGNTNTDVLTVTYNAPDTTAPGISITSPTSSATFTTTSATLSLGGTASDNVGVTQVAWSNPAGGSGTASGTTSWSVSTITLQSGINTITVTARDGAGNTASDILTVTYSPSDNSACSGSTVLCVDDTAGATQEYSTIQAAVNVVRAGDTILVHDGNYSGFTISADGASSNRITIKAAGSAAVINQTNGSAAVINQTNSSGEGITLSNAHYVTVEGFTITGMPGYGLATHNASATNPMRGLIIRNNTVQNSGSVNIYLSQVADSLIEGNNASGSGASHGIYLSNGGSDNTTLRNNRSFSNAKAGIHFNGDASVGGDGYQTGLLIENNLLYGNSGNGINMDGVGDSVIRNNVLYNNSPNALRGFQIDAAGGPRNLRIANNTFVAGSGWPIKLTSDQGGHVIFNNILINTGSNGSIVVDNTNFVSNYNILTDGFSLNGESTTISLTQWRNSGYDANSSLSTSSALFVNTASADYRLKTGAPAIDAGAASLSGVTAPDADITGAPRPQGGGHDIGAYESF